MKEKMKTRTLENEDWYEWIVMNMTDTDTADDDTQRMICYTTNDMWNSANNQSTQIHAGVIIWRLEASLEETKTEVQKMEDLISESAD